MSAVEVETAPREGTTREEARPAPPPPRHRRWRRRVLAVIGALLVIWIATSVAVAWVLTSGTHSAVTVSATDVGTSYEDVSFTSRVDDLTLKGWLFHAPQSNGRSVVFVHGWQANRVDTGSGLWQKARDMVQHGYDALLFDLRSCGTSAGDRFTLGKDEPKDVLGAYDFMVSRGYAPERMTVLAVSMGASSMLEAAPQLSSVGALISDSAYAELRPVIDQELPKRSHLPGFLFNWSIITSGRLLFGLDADLRPVDVVRTLPDRAFLFMHATGDDFVPPGNAPELYQASGNPGSRLDLIPAQGHTKEYLSHPDQYMTAVYAFIDAQLAGSARAGGGS